MPLAANRRPPPSTVPTLQPDTLADRRPPVAVVASDRDWAARALELALTAEGYATLRARGADQALALCAAAEPDVVFVEQRPAGLALCRQMRESGAVSDATPLVLLTADAVRRADLLEALAAGAWELWAFPGDAAALLARCAHWVRGKRHADRVGERGLTDRETGLYNLRGLLRRAHEVATGGRRGDTPAPLACVAFRAAPSVRQRPGALPCRVRDACRAVGRASDVYARVGGREFAVLAAGSTADGAARLVDRLRGALGDDASLADTALAADAGLVSAAEAGELVMRAVAGLDARG